MAVLTGYWHEISAIRPRACGRDSIVNRRVQFWIGVESLETGGALRDSGGPVVVPRRPRHWKLLPTGDYLWVISLKEQVQADGVSLVASKVGLSWKQVHAE